jgi:hypothetical protein
MLSLDPKEQFAPVVGYELAGFDPSTLLLGTRSIEPLPINLRLFLGPGSPADYVSNPLSWPICSKRLSEVIKRRTVGDVQIFQAPLFKAQTRDPVVGYEFVNACRCVPCLDIDRSKLSYFVDQPDEILVVYDFAIRTNNVDPALHFFRVEEWPFAIIISEELANDLVGMRFSGLALERCTTVK